MCGISGFIDYTKELDSKCLETMSQEIAHRGEDDDGIYFSELGFANLGLAHRRLSILDLSNHGHQPMSYGDLVIVYNGEIYNFKSIREELEEVGYTFESNSDTEVVLKSFHYWGCHAVNKFNGMFAIVLVDLKRNKMTLYRDRLGVKPLYYYEYNDGFLFSSELKGLMKVDKFRKQIDKEGLSLFLQLGYIPTPYTIFQNCFKLDSGSYLEFDLKLNKKTIKKYWDINKYYHKDSVSEKDEKTIINDIESLLIDSFTKRVVSDVPFGVFLSGGYDSSIVSAILTRHTSDEINTFTIGFNDKKHNESIFAKEIAKKLGTNHSEYIFTEKDLLDMVYLIPKVYDEPFGDPSALPTLLLSKWTKESVKVALSADGGDEIFGGYPQYIRALQNQGATMGWLASCVKFFKNQYPISINETRLNNFSQKVLSKGDGYHLFRSMNMLLQQQEVNKLLLGNNILVKTPYDDFNDELGLVNNMLLSHTKSFLRDDVLVKVDRSTMAFGLEGREPLLDYRIFEYMGGVPEELKLKNHTNKYLLKKIAYKYLPKDILDRPKKGFGVPLADWMRGDLKMLVFRYLNKELIEHEQIFNHYEVEKLVKKSLHPRAQNVRLLWNLLMFQMWKEEWL